MICLIPLAIIGGLQFALAQPAAQKVELREIYLRLGPDFWAESLFGNAAHIIDANETAEAILKGQKPSTNNSRLTTFKGEVAAFALNENDLGFVRDAFDFDVNPYNGATALRASAATMGPPNLIMILKYSKRLALTDEENFIKIKGGIEKCTGFQSIVEYHPYVVPPTSEPELEPAITELVEEVSVVWDEPMGTEAILIDLVGGGENGEWSTVAVPADETTEETLLIEDEGSHAAVEEQGVNPAVEPVQEEQGVGPALEPVEKESGAVFTEEEQATEAIQSSPVGRPDEGEPTELVIDEMRLLQEIQSEAATETAPPAPATPKTDMLMPTEAVIETAPPAPATPKISDMLIDITDPNVDNLVDVAIIKSTPAKIIYGEGFEEDPQKPIKTWSARRKNMCLCLVNQNTNKIAQIARNNFKVIELVLDCADPIEAIPQARAVGQRSNLAPSMYSFLQDSVLRPDPVRWTAVPSIGHPAPIVYTHTPDPDFGQFAPHHNAGGDAFHQKFGQDSLSSLAVNKKKREVKDDFVDVDEEDKALWGAEQADPDVVQELRAQQDLRLKERQAKHEEEKEFIRAGQRIAEEELRKEFAKGEANLDQLKQSAQQKWTAREAQRGSYIPTTHRLGHAIFTQDPTASKYVKAGALNLDRGLDDKQRERVYGSAVPLHRYGAAAVARSLPTVMAGASGKTPLSITTHERGQLTSRVQKGAAKVRDHCLPYQIRWTAETFLRIIKANVPKM